MTSSGPTPAETFLSEADDLLTELEGALLDLESAPANADQINRAFRALHTIKGSGAMFGFTRVADFTHHVENAFQKVRDGELSATPDLLSLTLAALDHIRTLLDGGGNDAQERTLLDRLAAITGPADQAPAPAIAPAIATPAANPPPPPASPARWRIRLALGPETMAFGTNPLMLLDELRQLGECRIVAQTADIPPLSALDPTQCHMTWDIRLRTDQPRSAIDDVFIFIADDASIAITPDDSHPDAPHPDAPQPGVPQTTPSPTSPETPPAPVPVASDNKRSPSPAGGNDHGSIRVQAERLDGLMDQVGELVIAQARLSQMAAASGDANLKSLAEEIERLSAELRDTTMGIRMLPIGTLFGRFRRVVRDLSQSLGKDVSLTMEGEDSELDKTVIERLNDPLVHLIRNCIDHGLEDAQTRRQTGKPVTGSVHLAARHSGAQVLISVTDDGRGMNRDAIRAKAEERGLIAPDTLLSDNDILGFIFHPGFSTAQQVSAVSGRGVGMDVVKRTIDSLRGTIDVSSSPGQGSTVTLKLPLTLAIIDGLLVRVGSGRYVIPLSVIEECVELSPQDDARATGCNLLGIRGDLIPFLRLRTMFRVTAPPAPFQKVVVASIGAMRVGLVVDQVIGQHQTVIKSLNKILDEVQEFSGATILGDGAVALILDVPRLVELGQIQHQDGGKLAS